MMRIKLTDVVIDPSIQIRDGNDEDTIQRYMESFDSLPAVDVFDTPEGRLLADGFHRCAAADRLGLTEIDAVMHEGTRADASDFAAVANLKHGKPLARGERIAAVRRLRNNHGDWTQDRIAKETGISGAWVSVVIRGDEVARHLSSSTRTEIDQDHLAAIHRAPPPLWRPLAEAAVDQKWSRQETVHAAELLREDRLIPEDRQALLSGELEPSDLSRDGRRLDPQPTFGSVKREIVRDSQEDAGARMLRRLMYEIDSASRWPMGDLLLSLTPRDRRQMRETIRPCIAWLEALEAALERDPKLMEVLP